MLPVTGEDLEELLMAMAGASGGQVDNALFEAAKDWDEIAYLSGYDVAISLCKKTKTLVERRRDYENVFDFIDNCNVDSCELNAEFVEFMLRHVRDNRLDLREQIRLLHSWLAQHDYSNSLRY